MTGLALYALNGGELEAIDDAAIQADAYILVSYELSARSNGL